MSAVVGSPLALVGAFLPGDPGVSVYTESGAAASVFAASSVASLRLVDTTRAVSSASARLADSAVSTNSAHATAGALSLATDSARATATGSAASALVASAQERVALAALGVASSAAQTRAPDRTQVAETARALAGAVVLSVSRFDARDSGTARALASSSSSAILYAADSAQTRSATRSSVSDSARLVETSNARAAWSAWGALGGVVVYIESGALALVSTARGSDVTRVSVASVARAVATLDAGVSVALADTARATSAARLSVADSARHSAQASITTDASLYAADRVQAWDSVLARMTASARGALTESASSQWYAGPLDARMMMSVANARGSDGRARAATLSGSAVSALVTDGHTGASSE